MENLEGRISISKSNQGKITIRIRDELSDITFVEAQMELIDFAEAITGLSMCPCVIETKGLHNVGKKMEMKTVEFKVSDKSFYGEIPDEIIDKNTPEGWISDRHFGSQSSIFHKGDETWARMTVRRWV